MLENQWQTEGKMNFKLFQLFGIKTNFRYNFFAQKADIEGYPDIASVFRSTAEGETGHACK